MTPSRSTVLLGGLVLAAVVSTHWVRFNMSPSVPLGFYRLQAVQHPVTKGTLVVFPVPSRMATFWPQTLLLLKPVAALAGEEVCAHDEELWIGPTDYGPVLREAQGKDVPHLMGCLVVEEGEVFVASRVPRSLDSRYYGTIPLTAITAQAVPLWTWR